MPPSHVDIAHGQIAAATASDEMSCFCTDVMRRNQRNQNRPRLKLRMHGAIKEMLSRSFQCEAVCMHAQTNVGRLCPCITVSDFADILHSFLPSSFSFSSSSSFSNPHPFQAWTSSAPLLLGQGEETKTGKRSDRPTDRQINRQTNKQTIKQKNEHRPSQSMHLVAP